MRLLDQRSSFVPTFSSWRTSALSTGEPTSWLTFTEATVMAAASWKRCRADVQSFGFEQPIRTQIIDGSTGVLVDPNLDSIVDAVRSLQSRRDWLLDLGRRARGAIEAEYRMDLVLDRVEKVYRSCL